MCVFTMYVQGEITSAFVHSRRWVHGSMPYYLLQNSLAEIKIKELYSLKKKNENISGLSLYLQSRPSLEHDAFRLMPTGTLHPYSSNTECLKCTYFFLTPPCTPHVLLYRHDHHTYTHPSAGNVSMTLNILQQLKDKKR